MTDSKPKVPLKSVALATTIFLIPFYIFRFKIAGVPTNVFEVGVFLLLIATIFQITRNKKQETNKSQIPDTKNQNWKLKIENRVFFASCILFLVSSLLGTWRAGLSTDSLGILKSWVLVPITFATVVSFQVLGSRRELESADTNLETVTWNLKPVLFGLYASTLVVSLWALLQKLGIVTTLFYQTGDSSFGQYLGANFRVFGPFESPNYLAMFIVPASILAFAINSKFKIQSSTGSDCPERQSNGQKQKAYRWLFNLSFILPLLALICSKSRAGIIALLGASVIYATVWAYRHFTIRKYRVFFTSSAIILYSLFIILVFFFALRPDSDAIRFQIYRYAWDFIKGNWLLGIGAGNFQTKIAQQAMTGTFRTEGLPYALHPHNLYMAMWLYFGILGLLSFLGITTLALVRLLKAKTSASLLVLAALAAILIHGIFDTTYFKNDLSAIYWLIIALAFTQVNCKPIRNNAS